MTLAALRSHLHQASIHLAALEAILEDLREGDLIDSVLKRALADLVVIEARLDGLADQLGEPFDPAQSDEHPTAQPATGLPKMY